MQRKTDKLVQPTDPWKRDFCNKYETLHAVNVEMRQIKCLLASRQDQIGRTSATTRMLRNQERCVLEESIIAESQLVCSTLSSAGQDSLRTHKFSVCIVDEACQASEASTLIPLQLG